MHLCVLLAIFIAFTVVVSQGRIMVPVADSRAPDSVVLEALFKLHGANSLVPDTAVIPKAYPLYKQCDAIWGLDWMNGTTAYDSICRFGCAMSSVAMALNGQGFKIEGYIPIYPGTFNAWLKTHDGYVCIDGFCSNLKLDSPNRIATGITFVSETMKPTLTTLTAYVTKQSPIVIAHVQNKTHFVLLTGYDTTNSTTFYVNDPLYDRSFYDYSEMADLILYDM